MVKPVLPGRGCSAAPRTSHAALAAPRGSIPSGSDVAQLCGTRGTRVEPAGPAQDPRGPASHDKKLPSKL